MLLRTHIAFCVLGILLIIPFVSHKATFVCVALFATIFPDFDTRFSKYGKNLIARTMQAFTKHRGAVHSLTMCTILSLILAMFFPIAALGFFTGYSFHLIADSFTQMGIVVFWPIKKFTAKGVIETGKLGEKIIFLCLMLVNVLLVAFYFGNYFKLL